MKSLSGKLGVILFIIGLIISGYGCPVVNIANAECAWVLWEKWEVAGIKDGKLTTDVLWTLVVATPKYEQCLEKQEGLFERIKKGADEDKEKYDTISEITAVPFTLVIKRFKSGEGSSHTLYCLPDTIDPRK